MKKKKKDELSITLPLKIVKKRDGYYLEFADRVLNNMIKKGREAMKNGRRKKA